MILKISIEFQDTSDTHTRKASLFIEEPFRGEFEGDKAKELDFIMANVNRNLIALGYSIKQMNDYYMSWKSYLEF